MEIPIVKQERVLSTVDAVDEATGLGILELYGMRVENTSGQKLVTKQMWSQDIYTESDSATGAGQHKYLQLDYDIKFQKPTVIDGIAVLNVPTAMVLSGTTTNAFTLDITGTIYISGSTLVSAGEGAAVQQSQSSDGTYYKMNALQIALTRKKIKPGEYLKLRILGDIRRESSGSGKFQIAHDPKNRSFASSNVSTMLLNLPVKIDI